MIGWAISATSSVLGRLIPLPFAGYYLGRKSTPTMSRWASQ